jgi:exonuclease SbcC
MRLHRLELQAFGSFPGREVLSFDELCDAGLFLLHGPTGAGKTTLLDAVSFALFGAVPGVRAADEGLRSHHAAPDLPTEVRLELTVRERRLRITRAPRQVRPKRRGSGVTVEQPRVALDELVDGSWIPRTTRLDEAGLFVTDLVGMGPTQFHQVAVLPQGGFAEFLRADAKDRGTLLEQLFATHRFTEVEQWLASRRKALADEVADERARLGAAVATLDALARQLPGADRHEGDEGDDGGPDVTDAASWAAGHLAIAEATVAAAEDEHRTATAAAQGARRAHTEGTELARRQAAHLDAHARRLELDAEAPRHRQRLAERDAGRAAAPLGPLLDDRDRRLGAAREADERAVAAREALVGLDPHLDTALDAAGLDAATIDAALERAIAEQTEAAAARELADDVERRDRQRREHLDQREARRRDEASASAELAALPERLEVARDGVRDAVDAEGRLERLRHELAAARARLEAGRRRDDLRRRLEAAADQARVAVDDHQAAVDHHQALVARRLEGMAAELATDLSPGGDCPVCGATDHPRPATPGEGGLVTAAEVDAARAAAEGADDRRRRAERHRADLATELATAEGAAGDATTDELAALLGGVEDDAEVARRLADELTGRRAELARLEEQEGALRARRDEAAGDVAGLTAGVEAVETELAEATVRLAALLGEHPDPTAMLAHADRRVAALREAQRAIAAAATCRTEADDADARVLDAATGAGFASLEEAASARRDPAALAALEVEVDAHAEAVARVQASLEDPDLVAAAAAAAPDVEALTAACDAADARLEASAAASGLARTTRDGIARQASVIEQLVAELGPLLARHDTVAGLAQLVQGTGNDNALRMQLSSYVLAARLEQVAAAATERLLRMSGGRYALEHCDTEADGRKRAGLGLRVVDAWSSTVRDTRSLSGGESFFASLALALGMADVVTAESGGTRIDTLFIDEGFGSLDEDTLNDVMDVLDDLREGGRTVGIVSHVADLRSRITAQVEVRKGTSGSTVRTAVPVA